MTKFIQAGKLNGEEILKGSTTVDSDDINKSFDVDGNDESSRDHGHFSNGAWHIFRIPSDSSIKGGGEHAIFLRGEEVGWCEKEALHRSVGGQRPRSGENESTPRPRRENLPQENSFQRQRRTGNTVS